MTRIEQRLQEIATKIESEAVGIERCIPEMNDRQRKIIRAALVCAYNRGHFEGMYADKGLE